MSSVEELFIESISPPEESDTELIITHADHESSDDERLYTTIEDHDMSSLHRWDHFSFYSIEEICGLHEESCFWQYPLIELFQ
jgi:hypothetical protein